MKDDLLVFCAHKMVDNMGRGGIATGVAEPFRASETFHDGRG